MKIWSADYHIFLVLIRTGQDSLPKPQQSRLTETDLQLQDTSPAHHINNLINVEGTGDE